MSITTLSKRYADAFLEFARDSIGFEKGLEELLVMKGIFRDNPEFMTFLESPEITVPEKTEAIAHITSAGFSRETRFFLELLLKKNRIGIFDHIAEYARIKYSHGEEVNAVLTAAYPLDTDQLQSIKTLLEKTFDKKLHLYMKLDSSLLGGVRAEVGNYVLDGSVQRRLEDLKEKLLAVRVS